MAGHRRISTDLFLRHLDRSVPRSKVEALLEVDLDDYRGERRPVKGYARLWGWSPSKVRRLLGEYDETVEDLYRPPAVGQNTTKPADPRRTPGGPEANPPTDPHNVVKPGGYDGPKDPRANPRRTPGEPQPDPYLEPEPKPEKEEPRRPLARGVDVAESRRNQARAQVELALERAPVEDLRARGFRRARLEILSDLFLAASRISDEAQLRAYYRATARIPGGLLRQACDGAFERSENGFAPAPSAINQAGQELEMEARKRARGRA